MSNLLVYLRQLSGKGANRSSVYSTVAYSDVTPGSLEIWQELPEVIKNDPTFTPFKELHEQKQGKDDSVEIVNENEGFELENRENLEAAARLMESRADEEYKEPSRSKEKIFFTLRILKLAVLVACWTLLAVSLLLNPERSEVLLHTAVKKGEIKEYTLQASGDTAKVLVTLNGPFVEIGNNSSTLQVWIQKYFESEEKTILVKISKEWTVYLQPEEAMDFSPSLFRKQTLELNAPLSSLIKNNTNIEKTITGDINTDRSFNASKLSLHLRTTSNNTVPLTVSYLADPISENDGIIYSMLLLVTLYILIIFEIVNRTLAALLTSSLAVAVLALTGSRPSLAELVSWLDVETLVLLFSMMILVAILAETGLFDCLAVLAFEFTGGKTWPLINCLCIFTAVSSTFLDNVTTILLITPVTIRLCEVMRLNPMPVLICMVIFSNVGGAATPVGDPPNVIIASQPFVLKQDINFATFTLHMGLGILLVCLQTYGQLRYMFRDIKKLRNILPNDLQEMRQEIAAWKRAASSLSSYTRDEDIVKRALEKKVDKLNTELRRREEGKGAKKSDPVFRSTLSSMKQTYKIKDKQLLVKSSVCILFVVIVFFLHSLPQLQRLSLGWTALLGALLLLVLSEKKDLEPILARVEWSTLLFFAGLFVLMEALSKLGLISWIGRITGALILKVGEDSRLAVAILLILWVSGLVSAFVDNIPLTTMMVRVVETLADSTGLGLPVAPLAWALSFGACLGGNGTLIGASANVVCAGVSEQHGYRFTFIEYLKIGFPVMLGNLIVASVYLLICHCLFVWH